MFVQDAWTINRMTLNMGVRFERFVGQIKDQNAGSGRFAPERSFSEVTGLPSWFDIAPRLGVSYDLFGTGRTALKASFGRYMAGQTTSFPARYNPLQLQSDTRTWRDTNGDNIAQASEIGASNNAAFGLPVQTIRPDPDIKREYDLEYTAQVQHELIRGLSVNLGFFRRGTHNQRLTQNLGWTPADYTIVNVVSPLDGTIIPVYNLDPAKRANVNRLDVNSTDSDLRAAHLQRPSGGLQRARPWLPVLRRLDDGSDHRYALRCDREQRWPLRGHRGHRGQQLPATRLPLLRPERARPAVPA